MGLSCTDRAIIHGLSHSFSPMLRDTEAERGHGTRPETQLVRAQPHSEQEATWA